MADQFHLYGFCGRVSRLPRDVQKTHAALMSYLNAVPANGRFWSADDMRVAWARAVYDKRANPYVPPNYRLHRSRPPMMPSSGATQTANEPNPWTMPKADLKKLAFGG